MKNQTKCSKQRRRTKWQTSKNEDRIRYVLGAINEDLALPARFSLLPEWRERVTINHQWGRRPNASITIDYDTGQIIIRFYLKRGFDPVINRRAYVYEYHELEMEHVDRVRWRYKTLADEQAAREKWAERDATMDRATELVSAAKKAEAEAQKNPSPENLRTERAAVTAASQAVDAMDAKYPTLYAEALRVVEATGGGQ